MLYVKDLLEQGFTMISPKMRQKKLQQAPLRREGAAEEVTDLVAYLASDKASFINGNNIDINGGLAFS